MKTVFVHGAGRDGAHAWPVQAREQEPEWSFLSRPGAHDEPPADAAHLVRQLGTELGVVVAASYGGIAALLAAEHRDSPVRGLVLFEPACFAVARGDAAVEAHVAAMEPVFAVASDPSVSDEEFSHRFVTGMGLTGPRPGPDQLAATVPRLRRTPPPWLFDVDASTPSRVPTLVVTGGWNPLYEAVADALASRGAEHVVVTGFGHRPQDGADANALIRRHVSGVARTR